MGTPEFAVPSLHKLATSCHNVVAVVTAPDKAKGRGRKMAFPEVKEAAIELGLPVFQPESLRDKEFQNAMRELKADVFIVVAFRILPPSLYSIPRWGAINAHGSLLPKYRGAAPIHWAVYHGETETGITTFKIDKSVDTGSLLLKKKLAISKEDTSGSLYERMKDLAAEALLETIDGLESESLKAMPQDENLVTKAPKIFPEMGELDFKRSSEELVNHIRAFQPFPSCWFMLGENKVKIHKATFLPDSYGKVAELTLPDKKTLHIHCGQGILVPEILQLPGRKALDMVAFLNGFNIKAYLG